VARFARAEDPGAAVAERLARALERIDAQRGPARLAVAGGSAAAALGALRRGLRAGVWGRLRLTWVDERCVPFADAESNRGAAYRAGHLDPADPPGLELPLFLDGEQPAAAAARVAAALAGPFQGGLDALLLGLGEDGHIASLFPGRPFRRPGDPLAFAVLDSPKPPACRITLSLALLATASYPVLLASGAGKRTALERLAQGDPALPGSALEALTVVTDQEVPERRVHPGDPLHGVTLERILTRLVDHYGWEELARIIDINCFKNDPSIRSSLTFLRKTPWARKKLEDFYLGHPD